MFAIIRFLLLCFQKEWVCLQLPNFGVAGFGPFPLVWGRYTLAKSLSHWTDVLKALMVNGGNNNHPTSSGCADFLSHQTYLIEYCNPLLPCECMVDITEYNWYNWYQKIIVAEAELLTPFNHETLLFSPTILDPQTTSPNPQTRSRIRDRGLFFSRETVGGPMPRMASNCELSKISILALPHVVCHQHDNTKVTASVGCLTIWCWKLEAFSFWCCIENL